MTNEQLPKSVSDNQFCESQPGFIYQRRMLLDDADITCLVFPGISGTKERIFICLANP